MSNPRNPRRPARRMVRFILSFTVVMALFLQTLPAGAVTQSDIEALKKEKILLAEKAEAQQETIEKLNDSQALFIDRKAALDAQIELNRQEIRLINEEIELYDQMILEKEEELAAAQEAETSQGQNLRKRMRSMEENSNHSYMEVLFEASSFADLLSRIADISDIMHYDKNLEESYINTRRDVEALKAEYEAVRTVQNEARAELDRKETQLDAQIKAASDMIADLGELSENAQAEYDAIAADRERIAEEIQELMRKLAEEEAARKAAEEAAKQQAQNNNPQPPSGGTVPDGGDSGSTDGGTAPAPNPAVPDSGGSAGGLMWPTPSCWLITSRYGYRNSPTAGASSFHQAIDIGAAEGAPIVAAASGTVEIAWPNGGYGNNVFINHGNGMATNYAHLSSIAVSAGQYVTQGQVIGYVGSTGIVTAPHLHFEVWVNGTRVDPTAYFSGYTFWNC